MPECDQCGQELDLYPISLVLSGGRAYFLSLCDRCVQGPESELLAVVARVGEWRGNIARFRMDGAPKSAVRNR